MTATQEGAEVLAGIVERLDRGVRESIVAARDFFSILGIRIGDKWPCTSPKLLLVGSESSGSTAVAKLLFADLPTHRFLEEGYNQWVWRAYQEIHMGLTSVRDYPRLQLFDTIKVPGFAMILPQFLEAFPNTRVSYIVRDPRDFINSAIKTWRVPTVDGLAEVPWSNETWLGLTATDPVERLALRWRTYLRKAESVPGVHFVRYEDFCANKAETIAQIAAAMDIPCNRTRVQSLQDTQLCHPSVRSYAPHGPGGWRRGLLSDGHIAVIEEICKKEMIRWQYPFSKDEATQ